MNLKNFYQTIKSKYIFVILFLSVLLIGILIISFYGFSNFSYVQENLKLDKNIMAQTQDEIYDQNNIYIFTDKISAPKTSENPINGVLYTAKQFEDMKTRPIIAVMIENQVQARPQQGLDKADIVYEALAEGGITRFMAVYWSKLDSQVTFGPIRSARNYYLLLASPYDPLYMHIGCAQGASNVDACGNRFRYGIKTMDMGGSFYRIKWKKAPHNAYSNSTMLFNLAKKRKFYSPAKLDKISVWKFKNDLIKTERGTTNTNVDINFYEKLRNGGLYDVSWKYNSDNNSYLRFIAKKPHLDESSKKQLEFKTIILQYTKMTQSGDSKGHLIFDIVGTGNADILQDGKVIKATWKKSSRTELTTYYDKTTKAQIPFNRGNIWVEILGISQSKVKFY